MLLAALALPLLAAIGLGLRARLTGALLLVAAYVPLAGAGPSIQRAGVMGAAGLLAALAGRPASRTYALLLAAAATLVLNPRAAGDPGWQLSFAAVVAILLLAPGIRDALVARRLPAAVADAAAITAAATLGTAPLFAFHFGRVSLAALPANLLAAPPVAPIMWLGMAAWARGRRLWRRGRGGLPALAAAGALVLALASGLPGCGRGLAAPPDPADLVVSFLDVGQGDATLVQHQGAAVLVDTGPPDGPILGRLRAAGVRSLDVLVVTHAQADHEGGASAVLSHFPVRLLLDGGDGATTSEHRALDAVAAQRAVRVVAPDAGQRVRAGPIELDVLWPHSCSFRLH